jgi:hypothetical protein
VPPHRVPHPRRRAVHVASPPPQNRHPTASPSLLMALKPSVSLKVHRPPLCSSVPSHRPTSSARVAESPLHPIPFSSVPLDFKTCNRRAKGHQDTPLLTVELLPSRPPPNLYPYKRAPRAPQGFTVSMPASTFAPPRSKRADTELHHRRLMLFTVWPNRTSPPPTEAVVRPPLLQLSLFDISRRSLCAWFLVWLQVGCL